MKIEKENASPSVIVFLHFQCSSHSMCRYAQQDHSIGRNCNLPEKHNQNLGREGDYFGTKTGNDAKIGNRAQTEDFRS